jgi:hypothetical protein
LKNKILALGLVLMASGVALSISSTGALGTGISGLGVIFFIAGMVEENKKRKNKNE